MLGTEVSAAPGPRIAVLSALPAACPDLQLFPSLGIIPTALFSNFVLKFQNSAY
jgi:hypothetical protein